MLLTCETDTLDNNNCIQSCLPVEWVHLLHVLDSTQVSTQASSPPVENVSLGEVEPKWGTQDQLVKVSFITSNF